MPVVLDYAQKLLSWRMNHDEQVLTHIALTHDGPVAGPRSATEKLAPVGDLV